MKQIVSLFIVTFLIVIPGFADEAYLFSPKGIAEVHITLDNGKNKDDIQRDEMDNPAEKLNATMVIKNSGMSTYDQTELYNGKIKIKGRGNTTWGVPKKPYSIDLVDVEGLDNPMPLLGMPEDVDWALLAFWHDRSLMRIPLAFYLGRAMNSLEHSPRLRYVEVYLNGEYRGLYCLSENIKRGKERVNVKKLQDAPEDQMEPRISGGYILEVLPDDKMKDRQEKETQFRTDEREIKYVFKYPKPKNVTSAQRSWIQAYMTEFERALYGNNFKDPSVGYQKYINEDSFIDWHILHDLSKGTDNLFHASIFLHKDRDGKLNMSAPWDFDISFGNVDNDCYYEDELWIEKTQYFHQLFKDERYVRKFIERYDQLMSLFNQVPQILKANLKQLEESGCIEREFDKWPQIYYDFRDKEGRAVLGSTRAHVRWLKDWFESRKTWLYINYGQDDEERGERLEASRPTIRLMDPDGFESGGSSAAKVMRGYTYIWNDMNRTSNENYNLNKPGKYWVQIRDANGYVSQKSKVLEMGVEEKDDPTDVVQHTFDDLFMYPNPVRDVLSISFPSKKDANMDIHLYDIQGMLIKSMWQNVSVGLNQFTLDLSDVSGGIYLIRYIIDKEYIVKKVVITN